MVAGTTRYTLVSLHAFVPTKGPSRLGTSSKRGSRTTKDDGRFQIVVGFKLSKGHDMPNVLAIVAHPDDIEFVMAGTLLQLAKRGWSVHYFNIANGCCGSMVTGREETASIRLLEAKRSASLIPAAFYEPVCNDVEIFYDKETIAKVTSVVRQADPEIVLTHARVGLYGRPRSCLSTGGDGCLRQRDAQLSLASESTACVSPGRNLSRTTSWQLLTYGCSSAASILC